MIARVIAAAVFVAFGIGCHPRASTKPRPTRSVFDVDFRVTTDEGEPLAGAEIFNGKSLLGTTGTAGHLKAELEGNDGEMVSVSLSCPAGYTSLTKPPPLRLTRMRQVTTHDSRAMQFASACKRDVRDVVVLVRADGGAQLPVRVDGRLAGSTNSDGIAHILVHAARTVRGFDVSLDTSKRHDLRPRNPSRTYELAEHDAILVFHQTLVPAPKAFVRRNETQPRKHIPYRID